MQFYFGNYGSASFPEKNGDISNVEVYHVFLEVTDVAAIIGANNALPRWMILSIEVLLQLLC